MTAIRHILLLSCLVSLSLLVLGCPHQAKPTQGGGSATVVVPQPTAGPTAVATAASTAAASAKPDAAGKASFQATVRIDAKPGGKQFQGVWLDRAGHEPLLIAYRPYGYWKPFEGKVVTVTGERYQPHGQSIGADHFRVHTMTVDPKSMTDFVRVDPELSYVGKFEKRAMPAGSKLAGVTYDYFMANDGVSYAVANTPKDKIAVGTQVRVKARQVKRSPFMSHVGGPHLWIIEIAPVP